ncbi:hypothetical protein BO70DRAFT_362148 [Aspergillus heteromorphus CBS 117.55]|uniref:ABM domain-containing protein n=1 Tax=Aspergillus heteromorphus CBS 117.55 TaxID=1448321 RepID=A0A317W8J7_9EURO|nr:uncharacterized protein BO70DRAFT_362148 [Aspergillus heteromorphus CBS 117.55]PWY82225.1 hypothetical protein BO70DRAFT_362148 [Aspergillus heteromorphus CBS 117.55]
MLVELSLFRHPAFLPSASSTLQSHLRLIAESSPSTYIYTQMEDPTYIYIIQPATLTRKNDKVEELSAHEGINLEWTLQIELNHHATDTPETETTQLDSLLPTKAPVIAIGRYFVPPEKKTGYLETFNATKGHLEAFTAPYPLAGGWETYPSSAGGDDKEDYVLFSGWDAVERHFAFADTEGFNEFAKIKGFLDGGDIKHVVRWEGVGQ